MSIRTPIIRFNAIVATSYGVITAIMIGAMFGNSQGVLLAFPLERPVFLREYSSGLYSSLAYFIAKTVIEVPLVFACQILQILITYWMIRFNAEFFILVMATTLLGICAASLALLIACSVTTAEAAV